MEKTFKIIKISEDGKQTMIPQFFHNCYGAVENAVTFNMKLHQVSNILDPMLRLKYRKGVFLPTTLSPRERAYVTVGTDVYCISEVFESEKHIFSLTFRMYCLIQ